MSSGEVETSFSELEVGLQTRSNGKSNAPGNQSSEGDVQVTCFTEDLHDVTLHFQIIMFAKQVEWRKTLVDDFIRLLCGGKIYVWIGCNTAKLGHLYAAATTRPNNTVSVTSVLGGTSDNTGSSMARRLVLKTGLNIVLACNIPKDSPMLEATAEKKLVEKLKHLGYIRSTTAEANTSAAS